MSRAAVLHLRRADPVMARVIERVGPCRFDRATDHTHFHHLCRAIVYQQLSTKAATTIFSRVIASCSETLEPDAVLARSDAELRAAGLSAGKTRYVKDLAARTRDGSLQLDGIDKLSDAEVIAALTTVKGIGVWSAQMFLMFRLGRMDVLPVLDLGIRKGFQVAYGMKAMPRPRHIQRIAKPWSPYSTIACWYLWRLLDGPAA